MMAAISAAMNGARVFLYEKNEYAGRKLLQTGNGKCNLSNESIDIKRYRGSLCDCGIASKVLDEFGRDDLLKLLSSMGLLIKKKNGGFYPRSDSARTVNDILIKKLNDLKVSVFYRKGVKRIERAEKGFSLLLHDLDQGKKVRESVTFDSVIVSTGGSAAPKTGSTGDGYYFAKEMSLRVNEPLPALTRLYSDDSFFKGINGVRADVHIKLFIDGEDAGSSGGELQITERGPSGICAFDLSGRIGRGLSDNKKCIIAVDFLPEYSEAQVKELLLGRRINDKELFLGIFSSKLSEAFYRAVSVFTVGQIECDDLTAGKIAGILKKTEFNIKGTGDFSESQVTTGGVSGSSFEPDLSVKGIPGMYFTGEVLDIDGDCGGFNLQWAFSSGFIAGKSAALKDDKDK